MQEEMLQEFSSLSEKKLSEVKAKAAEVKAKNTSVKKVIPIVVFGDEDDDKELYVGYFKRPGLVAFSKYMNLVQKDSIKATKELAKDCYLDGDRELIDDDELFIFGLMPQLTNIIKTKDGNIVNLSKAGK